MILITISANYSFNKVLKGDVLMIEKEFATEVDFEYMKRIATDESLRNCSTVYMAFNIIDFVSINKFCLEKLVEDGKDLNLIYYNTTLLYRSCSYNILTAVEYLLNHGADPNIQVKGGYTPLHLLSTYEPNKLVEKCISSLLDNGADINKPDDRGYTPIDFLYELNSKKILDMLKRRGEKIKGKNAAASAYVLSDMNNLCCLLESERELFSSQRGSLSDPINRRRLEEKKFATDADFEYLRKISTDKNLRNDLNVNFAFNITDFVSINTFCLEQMVKDGKDLNLIYYNTTLLYRACSYSISSAVKYLLEHGVNPNAQVEGGYTPLHLLLTYEPNKLVRECIELLLDNGADMNKPDDLGYTPMDFLQKLSYKEVLDMLKKRGTPIEEKDLPSDIDFSSDIKNLCDLLSFERTLFSLQNGKLADPINQSRLANRKYATDADFDYVKKLATNENIRDGLHVNLAVDVIDFVSINTFCLEKMVNDGRDLNLIYYNKPLLFRACYYTNSITAVKYLLEHGVNPNAKIQGGYTPLHLLFAYKPSKLIKDYIDILLDKGADISIPDDSGFTPIDFLYYYDNKDLLCTLKSRGKKIINRNFNTEDVRRDIYTLLLISNTGKAISNKILIDPVIEYSQKKKIFASEEDFEYLEKIATNKNLWNGLDINLSTSIIEFVSVNKFCLVEMVQNSRNLDLVYSNMTLLHKACSYPVSEDAVKYLLQQGVSPNSEMEGGYTPLHLLCLANDSEHVRNIIRILIDAGGNINKPDDKGYTPLDFFYHSGSKTLSNISINIERKDALKNTDVLDDVLNLSALVESEKNILNFRLENLADLITECKANKVFVNLPERKRTLVVSIIQQVKETLLEASSNADKVTFKVLLNCLVDVNEVDNDFLVNIINRSNNTLKDLINIVGIEKVNDVFNDIPEGKRTLLINSLYTTKNILCIVTGTLKENLERKIKTSLERAVINNNKKFKQTLLDTGIEIKKLPAKNTFNMGFVESNTSKKTSIYAEQDLLLAIKSGDRNKISKCLRSSSVNADVTDNNGKCALIYAIEKDDTETTLELIKKGADINKTDKRGMSVLMHAIKNNNTNIVLKLMQYGASLDTVDNYGRTTLMHALKKGESMASLINILLHNTVNNTNVNYTDKNGSSFLIYACAGGYKPAIKALVNQGADVNIEDSNGYTAVGLAFIKDVELTKYLIEHGATVYGSGDEIKGKSNEFWKFFNEIQNGNTNVAKNNSASQSNTTVSENNSVEDRNIRTNRHTRKTTPKKIDLHKKKNFSKRKKF